MQGPLSTLGSGNQQIHRSRDVHCLVPQCLLCNPCTPCLQSVLLHPRSGLCSSPRRDWNLLRACTSEMPGKPDQPEGGK